MQIISTIQIRGANPYVYIEANVAAKIKSAWRKPMPVILRIDGAQKNSWKTNMMPDGNGGFYLYLHGGMRNASKTTVGDTVTLSILFDSSYQNGPAHPMPTWFTEKISGHATARESWEKLPPSRQKELLRYFAGLKSAEAQERNANKAFRVLSGKEERFMGRLWKNGI